MLVADTVIRVAYGVKSDFAVLVRQRNQLAAGMLFGSAAFVGVDVSVLAAQNSVIGAIQSLKAEHIGSGPVKSEENVDAGAEMLLKLGYRRAGIGIVPIGHDVALIGAGD